MESSFTRILLAEDFKPYRTHTIALLGIGQDCEVFSVEDGTEAVVQARQLKPDVILMDIGLPRLNGIAATRQILELLPSAKVIFLTQQADTELMKQAFNMGALGYVLKQDARFDLLSAIKAVLAGKRFVSRGLSLGLELS